MLKLGCQVYFMYIFSGLSISGFKSALFLFMNKFYTTMLNPSSGVRFLRMEQLITR